MEECTAKEDVAGAIVVEKGAEDGALIGLMLVLGGVDIRLIALRLTAKNMTNVSNDVIHVTVLVDILRSWWLS